LRQERVKPIAWYGIICGIHDTFYFDEDVALIFLDDFSVSFCRFDGDINCFVDIKRARHDFDDKCVRVCGMRIVRYKSYSKYSESQYACYESFP